MEQMNSDELARFMQGKLLRYNNKLYRHHTIGDDNATISIEHEANQEQT
jgi:hypothetical protein